MIYAIVLNWNNPTDTIECISSLKKINNIEFKTLCIDNNSNDDSIELIRKSQPDIEIIKTQKNLGYAGGNNFGIKHAIEKGAEYFWILNNDTVVDSNALKPMIDILLNNKKIGIVGSIIMRNKAKEKIWFAGGLYNRFKGYTSHYLENQNISSVNKPLTPSKYDFVSGCSWVITKKTVDKIGLLDESLFLYYEEIDYCIRAKKAGIDFVMCPGSIVYHKISKSINDENPLKIYYYTRNRLRISKKILLFLPAVCIFMVYQVAFITLFSQKKKKFILRIKSIFRFS